MISTPHYYETVILESRLDSFGHVNHAEYVKLFEEARWDLITHNGYGLEETLALAEAPVVIDLSIKFRKELRLRERVRIETVATAIRRNLIHLRQELRNPEGKLASQAEITIALIDLTSRRMITPTEKFLHAIGVSKV